MNNDADVLHYPTSAAFDVECYRDYFLVAFDSGEYYELFEGHPLDKQGLKTTLESYLLIGFNSLSYDLPIITLALADCNNEQLKDASDDLIVNKLTCWSLLRKWGVEPLANLNHIDLFDVAPGMSSLKMYGAKLHTTKLQDLPFDPNMTIDLGESVMLREYCFNDLKMTRELYNKFLDQISLREEMGKQYQLELRSKSDAQIAETVFKQQCHVYPDKPAYPTGMLFKFKPYAWMQFKKLELLEILATCDFEINENGSVKLPDALVNYRPIIGNTTYTIGIGGLHSNESNLSLKADTERCLCDFDVASYYPAIMLNNAIEPPHLKGLFLPIYQGWFADRLAAKKAGNKKAADMKKIVLNGTFGKFGSWYSVFYAPTKLIQVTLSGQIALLMLIENLELCGIPVISANTDGIVVNPLHDQLWLVHWLIAQWEKLTGFQMEQTDYSAYYGRDVNSYIAVGAKIKTKGAFAAPIPIGGSWPAPTASICNIAVIAFLTEGIAVETTIRQCTDIKQFVSVRKVTGGGYYSSLPNFPKALPKYRQAELCEKYAKTDYRDLLEWAKQNVVYLGKTVRWYYVKDSAGHIQTSDGNLVATTEGCEPLMTLPETLPLDLDYQWYIDNAKKILIGFDNAIRQSTMPLVVSTSVDLGRY